MPSTTRTPDPMIRSHYYRFWRRHPLGRRCRAWYRVGPGRAGPTECAMRMPLPVLTCSTPPHYMLSHWVDDLLDCRRLTVLSLGGNRLTVVPESLGQLAWLQVLVLSDNLLESLPAAIANLKHLKSLLLHKNRLRTLPPQIVACKCLTEVGRDSTEKAVIFTPPRFKGTMSGAFNKLENPSLPPSSSSASGQNYLGFLCPRGGCGLVVRNRLDLPPTRDVEAVTLSCSCRVAVEPPRQPAGGAVRARHDAQPAQPAGAGGARHQAARRALRPRGPAPVHRALPRERAPLRQPQVQGWVSINLKLGQALQCPNHAIRISCQIELSDPVELRPLNSTGCLDVLSF